MKKSLFCFVLTALSTISLAQRPTSAPSTTGCYRQFIMPISAIPTLHSDMTPDCILGYIYLDSLCRSFPNWDSSENFLNSLPQHVSSWDTLRTFMRFLYRLNEYDASLFREFILSACYLDTNYKMMPGTLEKILYSRMDAILGYHSKLGYLTSVPLILHIHVTDTIASQDSMCYLPFWPQPRMCVAAQVIDTIKGIHFINGDCGQYREKQSGKKPEGDVSCINIDYSPVVSKQSWNNDLTMSPSSDSGSNASFICDSCYGYHALVPGKDYIVFLETNFLDYNGANSFYEYVPYNGYNYEGGIFPIDSTGNVLSEDNFFGYGNSVPLAIFESNLKSDISTIVSH